MNTINTKEQKVKLLEAIAAGTTTIESMQPVKVRMWVDSTEKSGWLFCKAEKLHYPKDQQPRGLNILNMVVVSGGQPERNSEAAVMEYENRKI